MRKLNVCVALSIILLNAGSARDQTIPGRWKKVASLPAGTAVIVTLKSGDRYAGVLHGMARDSLTFEVGGKQLMLPKSEVLTIETASRKHDRLRNGALIGAAAGAATGMAAMYGFQAAVNAPGSRWSAWGEDNAAYMLAGGLVGAGLGLGIGALVDSRVQAREMVYKAR